MTVAIEDAATTREVGITGRDATPISSGEPETPTGAWWFREAAISCISATCVVGVGGTSRRECGAPPGIPETAS